MIRKLGTIGIFIGAVFAAMVIINFALRGSTAHNSDNPAVQGINSILG